MNKQNYQEEIDAIMEEMEAKTPKPEAKDETFKELNGHAIVETFPNTYVEKVPESSRKFLKVPEEEPIQVQTAAQVQTDAQVADVPDAKRAAKSLFSLLVKDSVKPGIKHPSMPTNERYYDFTNTNVGLALIFNQNTVKGEHERIGSRKDATDLNTVLSNIGFDVKVFNDLTVSEIKKQLLTSKFTYTWKKHGFKSFI